MISLILRCVSNPCSAQNIHMWQEMKAVHKIFGSFYTPIFYPANLNLEHGRENVCAFWYSVVKVFIPHWEQSIQYKGSIFTLGSHYLVTRSALGTHWVQMHYLKSQLFINTFFRVFPLCIQSKFLIFKFAQEKKKIIIGNQALW